MLKKILSFFPAMALVVLIASCMDDPITGYEAEPRSIFRPTSVGFTFLEYTGGTTGDIQVHWRRSPSDTQLNFAGYVARLLAIDTVRDGDDSWTVTRQLEEKIVDRTIFTTTFTNVDIQKAYAVAVWGMRNSTPDTLVLSRDSMAKEFVFDPRPIDNPTELRAASLSSTAVRIEWDLPATHAQGNVLSYSVYVYDPSKLGDSARFNTQVTARIEDKYASANITVPAADVGQGLPVEKEYEFRVIAMRLDSTLGRGDSAKIRWSGGEKLIAQTSGGSQSDIPLGSGLFVGRTQGRYIAQAIAADNEGAWMKFEDAGENVRVTGLNSVRLFSRIDATPKLDTSIFTRPLDLNEYTETELLVPKQVTNQGWTIYARQTGKDLSPLRLRFVGVDTTIVRNNGVSLEMIYQPKRDDAPPLPYF